VDLELIQSAVESVTGKIAYSDGGAGPDLQAFAPALDREGLPA
jgi:hypothetical protein